MQIEEPEIYRMGVAGFAKICHRSAAHVSRECRRWTGKTPTELVNRARLKHAKYKLRTSAQSVTEIAQDCGFDDPAQFYRIFKLALGVSPKNYRNDRDMREL